MYDYINDNLRREYFDLPPKGLESSVAIAIEPKRMEDYFYSFIEETSLFLEESSRYGLGLLKRLNDYILEGTHNGALDDIFIFSKGKKNREARKQAAKQATRTAKQARMKNPGGTSKYAQRQGLNDPKNFVRPKELKRKPFGERDEGSFNNAHRPFRRFSENSLMGRLFFGDF